MIDLPLFPLGAVLFPRMPLTLHIFEPRYKDMIQLCLDESRPFGVVLIEKGREVGEAAQPHKIGCMAQISKVIPLEDGRMNLIAVGGERFRIESLDHSQSYLMGQITPLPLQGDADENTKKLARGLRTVLTDYLDVLSNIGKTEFDTARLPFDSLELAYLTAALLQAPIEKKQKILEINELHQLVSHVYATCRREIPLLRQMISPPMEPISEGIFSLN